MTFSTRSRLLSILSASIVTMGGIWLLSTSNLRGEVSDTAPTVIKVTTLNPDGPGSLGHALSQTGPRIIVFEVGGVIDLRTKNTARPYQWYDITNGDVVIAGETAPEPGIHLVGAPLQVRASNVIIRHLSVYTGTQFPYYLSSDAIKIDAITGEPIGNILIENNAFYWAIDETGETWTDPTKFRVGLISNVTFRENIFGEGLHSDLHPKGPHSNGFLVSHGAQKITFDKNLFASNFRRNPWITGNTSTLLLNNYIYNPGRAAIIYSGSNTYGTTEVIGAESTLIGNVCRAGPNTQAWLLGDTDGEPKMIYGQLHAGRNTKVYMQDNSLRGTDNSEVGKDAAVFKDDAIDALSIVNQPMTWLPVTSYTILPSAQVEEYVLSHAGPRPTDRNRPHTNTLLAAIRSGTHHIIASESEVGGYPTMTATQRAYSSQTLLPIPQGFLGAALNDETATGGTTDGQGGSTSTTGGDIPPPTSATLVGSWMMNQAALGADSSGNGNTLTPHGAPTRTNDTNPAAIFQSSSNDYLQSATAPQSLHVDGGDFTISAWFKPTSIDATHLKGIAAKSNFGRFGNATFQIYQEKDIVRFTIGDQTINTGSGLSYADVLTSVSKVIPGSWNHVYAWYDGSADQIHLSLNGESILTKNATNTSGFREIHENGYMMIGTLYGHARFDGEIDDVQFWKGKLTSTERVSIMAANSHFSTATQDTNVGSNAELVGSWTMDGASLGLDTSGYGSNLKVFGQPIVSSGDNPTAVFHTASNDYLQSETPPPALHVDGESFILSGWFKPTSVDIDEVRGIVAKSRYGRFGNATFQVYHLKDTVYFTIGDQSPTPADSRADVISSPTRITAEEWHHVLALYDATADTISLSVNGETPVSIDATNTSGFQRINEEGNFLIGSLYNVDATLTRSRFDGEIDDVQMWKGTMTESERRNLFTENYHYRGVTDIDVTDNGASGEGNTNTTVDPSGSNIRVFDTEDSDGGASAPYFRYYPGEGYNGAFRYFSALASRDRNGVRPFISIDNLQPNTKYGIYLTWPHRPFFTNDVPLTLQDLLTGTTTTVTLDQTQPPRNDIRYADQAWQKIGELTTDADGSNYVLIRMPTLSTSMSIPSYTVFDALLVKPE